MIRQLYHLHQALQRMSISKIASILQHLMSPVHNAIKWRALSWNWDHLKRLKILDNCVASSIKNEGLVFHQENQIQIRLPGVEELPLIMGND